MNKKQKKNLRRIIAAAFLYIAGMVIEHALPTYVLAADVLMLIAYAIVGGDVLYGAARNIIRGKVFDEAFLMALATIGAIAIGEFPEGVAVMLFYQVGELFQSVAVDKSRKSISSLMDIRPDYANLKVGDETKKVDPYDVKIGDIIIVKPGEKVPLDGQVVEGESFIDTMALTGESVPRSVRACDMVMSGCVNKNGLLQLEVTKEFGESTVHKILELVENASSKKSNSENFITRFAAVYTPAVVIGAILLAFVPPIFISGHPFATWIYRALTFLVVSCPCALVISIPLSFFGGIGGASKRGILVKGSNYLEALAKAEIVVCDKTGTLTKGVFIVQSIVPVGVTEDELLEYAAYAESYSSHPIAASIRKAYVKAIDESKVSDVNEQAGAGLLANVFGRRVLAGNEKLMKAHGIAYTEVATSDTIVYIAIDERYAGYILIADEIKEDAARAIASLKENGIKKTVMLTGDHEATARDVAEKLGIDEVHFELLPGDKVDLVERLLDEKSPKGKLVFVGDGINDAPVLARADIGVAMGGLGSDAAIEAADVVIMTDEPSKLAVAVKIARRTLAIANQNTIFAIAIKLGVLLLGALGLANMWEAVFADVGVAVIAILNSMRNLNTKGIE